MQKVRDHLLGYMWSFKKGRSSILKSNNRETNSFLRQKPSVSPFAWKSNKAYILFCFTALTKKKQTKMYSTIVLTGNGTTMIPKFVYLCPKFVVLHLQLSAGGFCNRFKNLASKFHHGQSIWPCISVPGPPFSPLYPPLPLVTILRPASPSGDISFIFPLTPSNQIATSSVVLFSQSSHFPRPPHLDSESLLPRPLVHPTLILHTSASSYLLKCNQSCHSSA